MRRGNLSTALDVNNEFIDSQALRRTRNSQGGVVNRQRSRVGKCLIQSSLGLVRGGYKNSFSNMVLDMVTLQTLCSGLSPFSLSVSVTMSAMLDKVTRLAETEQCCGLSLS